MDVTCKEYPILEEGRCLLVFPYQAPKEPWRSVGPFTGECSVLTGGEARWLEPKLRRQRTVAPWKDKNLQAAGFQLQAGVRAVAVVELRLAYGFSVNLDVEVLDAAGKTLETSEDYPASNLHLVRFDLPPEDGGFRVRLELSDSVLGLDEVPLKSKFKKCKGEGLEEQPVKVESRLVSQLEFFAEGQGDFDRVLG